MADAKPLVIGLTGSIGMGKTTTAGMFRAMGCPVFDADAEVHKIYAEGGEGAALIKAVFPDAIKDGAVDRSVLGTHMRRDPLNLQVLESFIHPMVAKSRAVFLTAAINSGEKIVVFDVPLLFETGGHAHVDKVVVVTASADVQRKRVLARRGMNEDLFESLLARQMPDKEKRARADYLIFTDKGLDHANGQVETLIKTLTAEMA